MCDLRDIVEVKELTDAGQVNDLLGNDWELIAAAPGQTAEKRPVVLYSLGRVCTPARKDMLQL